MRAIANTPSMANTFYRFSVNNDCRVLAEKYFRAEVANFANTELEDNFFQAVVNSHQWFYGTTSWTEDEHEINAGNQRIHTSSVTVNAQHVIVLT
eukprot:1719444-Amphidinium_carterae.3